MLIVLGGMFSLGVGALVVIGGAAYFLMNATPEQVAGEPTLSGEPTTDGVSPALSGVPTTGGASPALPNSPPRPTSTPLRPDLDAEELAGADPSRDDHATGESPSLAGANPTGKTPASSLVEGRTPTEGPTATSPSEGPSNQGASSGAAAGGTSWWCTASASVRVCGFAGACNYQMVFGNGVGNDRFLASQQAKRSCEASARAKGATAFCVVQCSPR